MGARFCEIRPVSVLFILQYVKCSLNYYDNVPTAVVDRVAALRPKFRIQQQVISPKICNE